MNSRTKPFVWPEGKRAAVSLSWDDARPSQLDIGLPILDRHDVKASFYVLPRRAKDRVKDWKAAFRRGHEAGNHTLTHPCSANFPFSRENALEDYSLARIERELSGANAKIKSMLGVTPRTFAYCCGQTFVGRGLKLKSYIPLVARDFVVGRRCFDETCNDPTVCDLAQVMAMDLDGRAFTQVMPLLRRTVELGGWLIFVGHDVGWSGAQTTSSDTLERICAYAQDKRNGLWIDTVGTIGQYIASQRRPSRPGKKR